MSGLVLLLFIGLAASEFDHDIHHKYITLPKQDFINYFNSLNHSWVITDNSEIFPREFGAQLKEDHGLPTITHDVMDLPVQFDSRNNWPQCETIRQIYNQGHCGSCFLFGSINSASDRTCIHKNIHVHLAEQEGDCIKPFNVCHGGSSSEVFKFWVENGLVTDKCKPYDVPSISISNCKRQCENTFIEYVSDKHFGARAYKVDSNIDTIRAEIVKNGPVVGSFAVFSDFYDYKGGVYEHKYGHLKYRHAVRLIGYGVDERGVDFWILANSWGPNWGENGFFRMKRGQPELGFEADIFAGLPK